MGSAPMPGKEFSTPRIRPPMRLKSNLLRHGWCAFFVIFCCAIYFQKSRVRDMAISELSYRLHEMERQKMIVCKEREDLQSRLQSQSDPAWIEMVLMRDLGVVPDGWVKVRFTH